MICLLYVVCNVSTVLDMFVVYRFVVYFVITFRVSFRIPPNSTI